MIRSGQLAIKPLGDMLDSPVVVEASPRQTQQPHDNRHDGPPHGQKPI
jgi:hypothetical protein